MCETGPAGFLVLRSDVVPKLEIDDRCGMVLVSDDGEAIC